jgi:drug/metabolite transporter (DMT)-like permease
MILRWKWDSWKAYAALLIVYVVWGTTIGSIRIGVTTLPWALVPCIRFLTAGLLMTGFCLWRGERLPGLSELRKHVIAGTLMFVGGNTVVCWAVQHITTGLGGLMTATLPFWVVWLSNLIPPRESVSRLVLGGILMGFAGMVILLSPQLGHLADTPPLFWWSVLAMLLNAFCWALGSVYVRRNPMTTSLLMGVGVQNLIAGLILLPVCILTIPPSTPIQPNMAAVLALLYLIGFGTLLATPCYLYTLRHLPVSVSSTFAYVTPVITLLVGWLALGESLTQTTLLGMGVILTGVVIVQCLSQQPGATSPQREPEQTTSAVVDQQPPSPELESGIGSSAGTDAYTGTASISIASRR